MLQIVFFKFLFLWKVIFLLLYFTTHTNKDLQIDTDSRRTFSHYIMTNVSIIEPVRFIKKSFTKKQTSAFYEHVQKSKHYVIKAIRSIHRTPKLHHQSILPFRGDTINIRSVFCNELQFNMQRNGRAIPNTLCVQLPT